MIHEIYDNIITTGMTISRTTRTIEMYIHIHRPQAYLMEYYPRSRYDEFSSLKMTLPCLHDESCILHK